MSDRPMDELASGFEFLEGPVYDAVTQALYVADLDGGGVWRLAEGADPVDVASGQRGISSLALHADGGLVLATDRILWTDGTHARVLHDAAPADGVRRYNDITTDSLGRLYAGTLDWDLGVADPLRVTGCLHCLDVDGTSRVVARDVMITNGLGFSPADDRLYHVDTATNVVWCYRVDERGDLHDRRPFFRWSPDTPRPDGLAVAVDGTVWVALHDAGVAVLGPDGTERRRIPVPAGLVTSLCFGGTDLTTLFVVTGGPRPAPGSGRVFRYDADVAGVPVGPCRVPLSRAAARSRR